MTPGRLSTRNAWRIEPLFAEKGGGKRGSTEPTAGAVDELPEELRRIVARVSSRLPADADA